MPLQVIEGEHTPAGNAEVAEGTVPASVSLSGAEPVLPVTMLGADSESGSVEAENVPVVLPVLPVPDRDDLGRLARATWSVVATDELVLHPQASAAAEKALAFLSNPLGPREKAVKFMFITGPTGNGKTTLSRAISNAARGDDALIREFKANGWKSGTRHETTDRMRADLDKFARQVQDRVATGHPATGVLVIQEAHTLFGDPTDVENDERVAEMNDWIDTLQETTGAKILVIFTGRKDLAVDLQDRSALTVHMENPDEDARALVMRHLLRKEVYYDAEKGHWTSDALNDELVETVVRLSTMTEADRDQLDAYLRDRTRQLVQPNPDYQWAEKFFAVVNATEGFNFREMGTLFDAAFEDAGGKPLSLEDLAHRAQLLRVDVRKRQRLEESETLRRSVAA